MSQGLEVKLVLDDEQIEYIIQRIAQMVVVPTVPAPVWIDAAGAAKHLATSKERIYDLVQVGKLTPQRDGRRLLFRIEDLDTYLEATA